MQFKEHYTINFGEPVDTAPARITGWDEPEDGRRWARSSRSSITLPKPDVSGDMALLLTIEPFLYPPILTQQTLRVVVNGVTVWMGHPRRRTSFCCRLPATLLATRPEIDVGFDHPDMLKPNLVSASPDTRSFSIGFVSMVVMEPAAEKPASPRPTAQRDIAPADPPPGEDLTDGDLLGYFSSLGDNCEFGLTQRRAGIEPMDLLRFTGIWYPGLLAGIEEGFAAIENYDELVLQLFGGTGAREYISYISRYNMESHTGVFEGEMTPARLLTRELKKLRVMRRLILSDMTHGNRIFLYKCNDLNAASDVQPLLDRLLVWGPATLMLVVRGDAAHPPGTVEMLRPGLLHGYIDRLNPYDDASAPASALWLDICRQAYALWRTTKITVPESLSMTAA